MKKPTHTLRIRSYTSHNGLPFVSVLLMQTEGVASQWRLFGEMSPAAADQLAEALNLPVEREHSPFENVKRIKPGSVIDSPLFQQEAEHA